MKFYLLAMTILIGAFGIVSLLALLVVGMTEGVLDPTKNSATLAIFLLWLHAQ